MTQAPRTARFSVRWTGAALWAGAFSVILIGDGRALLRLTALSRLAVGLLIPTLLSALLLALRRSPTRRVLRLLRPGLTVGAAPVAVLTGAAGGVASSVVALPVLWVLALSWLGAQLNAVIAAAATLGLLVVTTLVTKGAVAFTDAVCAAGLLAAAVAAPVLARRRGLSAVLGSRRHVSQQPRRRAQVNETAEVPSLPATFEGTWITDLGLVRRYLSDIRVQSGADEVVLWEWTEAERQLAPMAWSGLGDDLPRFAAESGGPLVEWAAREAMAVTDPGDDEPRLVAAPIHCGARRFGAVALFADAGLRLPRPEAKGWCARHAAHLGGLLELLEARRNSARDAAHTRALLHAGERFQQDLQPDTLARTICDAAVEVSGASGAALVSWNTEQGVGEVVHATPWSRAFPGLPLGAESLAAIACRDRQRFVVSDATRAARGASIYSGRITTAATRSLAVVPLVREHVALGAIIVEGERPEQVGPAEGEVLAFLAQLAALAWENSRRLSAASAQASTDALTGLANRYAFDARLKHLLAESDRYGQSAALILMDLDLFKRVNDTHGHEAGDVVLHEAARIVARTVRSVDLACRYGGEELAVILPQTGIDGALLVAERLRERVGARRIPFKEQQLSVTASFGVACYPDSATSASGLFASADRALYAAKTSGRNCVRLATVSDGEATV